MPLIRGLRYATMRGFGLLGNSQGGGGSFLLLADASSKLLLANGTDRLLLAGPP